MTKDDILRMAIEAGMEVHERKGQVRIGSAVLTGADSTEQVERFAQLVAAHERDQCAKACASLSYGVDCLEAIRNRGNA